LSTRGEAADLPQSEEDLMNRTNVRNTTLTALGLVAAAGLVLLTFPGGAGAQTGLGGSGGATEEGNATPGLPETITLTGTVRDFHEKSVEGGHPDFERKPDSGFGHFMGAVASQLGADGKPVWAGAGKRVNSNWRDSAGRNIHPSLYNRALGDVEGSYGAADNAMVSADTFRSWFRDVPGLNVSAPLSITLKKESGTNRYVFDDRYDPLYSGRGGFFPINGELLGNSAGGDKNFHFTFELATEFTYKAGTGQVFTFNGDDDVWVFIDNRLVIDIGGVHSRVTQTVALDRLGLQDGRKYNLNFFFAERHRTQSNFRIETTLNLRNAELPATANLFD
jgi:fibro-slime domain-containing protein